MRETRSSGSVEGVMSNRDPYSDSGHVPELYPGVGGGWRRLLLRRPPGGGYVALKLFVAGIGAGCDRGSQNHPGDCGTDEDKDQCGDLAYQMIYLLPVCSWM